MLETKLSPNKVRKMISQFKSGKIFMEKITDKKYLFIGFLKAEKFESYVKKKVEGIEFIIYGIKRHFICGRNLTRVIDWKSVVDIKEIKEKLELMNNKLDSLINNKSKKENFETKEMKEKFELMNNKLDSLINDKSKKQNFEIKEKVDEADIEKGKTFIGQKLFEKNNFFPYLSLFN